MGQKIIGINIFDVTILLKFTFLTALVIVTIITNTYSCFAFPSLEARQKLTQKAENQKQDFIIAHPADITRKIKEIEESINQYEITDKKSLFEQRGIPVPDITLRSEKLKELKAGYESVLIVLKNQATLQKNEEFTRDKINKNQSAVSKKPQYSLSFYDQLRDQLTDAQQQKRTAGLAKKLAKQALENAQTRLDEVKSLIRNLKDQLAQKEKTVLLSKLKWDLETANINAELAWVMVDLLRLRLKNIEKQIEISTLVIEQLKQNIQWVKKNLHFDGGEAADADVKAAVANRFPNLDLNSSWIQNQGFNGDGDDTWALFVQLQLPLWDGGSRRSAIA